MVSDERSGGPCEEPPDQGLESGCVEVVDATPAPRSRHGRGRPAAGQENASSSERSQCDESDSEATNRNLLVGNRDISTLSLPAHASPEIDAAAHRVPSPYYTGEQPPVTGRPAHPVPIA